MGYLVKGRNIPPFCRESVSAKVRFSPTQHLWSDLCSRIEWWGRIQGRETTTSFMLCWPGLAKAKRVNKDTMHINTHAFTHIHKSRCCHLQPKCTEWLDMSICFRDIFSGRIPWVISLPESVRVCEGPQSRWQAAFWRCHGTNNF